jgi:hypothetical protein
MMHERLQAPRRAINRGAASRTKLGADPHARALGLTRLLSGRASEPLTASIARREQAPLSGPAGGVAIREGLVRSS